MFHRTGITKVLCLVSRGENVGKISNLEFAIIYIFIMVLFLTSFILSFV